MLWQMDNKKRIRGLKQIKGLKQSDWFKGLSPKIISFWYQFDIEFSTLAGGGVDGVTLLDIVVASQIWWFKCHIQDKDIVMLF